MRTITEAEVANDLWGDTVNLASRLGASGGPGRILAHGRGGEISPAATGWDQS